MSWFNPKAFAAGALKELDNIVETNFEEAKKYEEQQRELFKNSKLEIQRRNSIVGGLLGVATELEQTYGVSKEVIQAAHSSGPQGLLQLKNAIETENTRRSKLGGKLAPDDITAMIKMGGLTVAKNPEFEEMDYKTFFEKSMNLGTGNVLEPEVERNFLQKALGGGAKAAAKARLDREMSGDLSILDINEAAARNEYNSLMPGSYATFTPTPFFEAGKALKEFTTLDSALMNQIKTQKFAKYEAIGAQSGKTEGVIKAEQLAFIQNLKVPYVAGQVQMYGLEAIEKSLVNYENEIGRENLNRILMNNNLPIVEQQEIETSLALKGDIVTIPMGGDLQAIVTMGPNGPLSVQKVSKSNPNMGAIVRDPNEITTFIEELIKRGKVSENIMQQGQLDAEVYYDTLQSTTDAAFTDPRTGEVLGAEYLNPDVLESAQDFRESDQVFTGQTAGLMSAQELQPRLGTALERAEKTNLDEFNEANRLMRESQEASYGVLSEDRKQEIIIEKNKVLKAKTPAELNSQDADELLINIIDMASANEKQAALVEEFFGEDKPTPTKATFRQFKNALKTSSIGEDPSYDESRDALQDEIILLENELLRDGEPAKTVWDWAKASYNWMMNNAASEKKKKEAKEK